MKKTIKKISIYLINSLLMFMIVFSTYNIYKYARFKSNINNSKRVTNIDIINNSSEIDKKYNFDECLVPAENIEIFNDKYDEFIKIDGSVNDNIILYLKNKLNLIPDNILSAYFNNGGTILLTSKNISKTYYSEHDFGKIVGLHDATKNIVYISNSEYAIDYALIHEFGHVLDSLTDWDSMKDDFKNIFNIEKDTLEVYSIDGHYKSNEREFFAEVFQEYIINPETCKNSAPKAFKFIENKINEI